MRQNSRMTERDRFWRSSRSVSSSSRVSPAMETLRRRRFKTPIACGPIAPQVFIPKGTKSHPSSAQTASDMGRSCFFYFITLYRRPTTKATTEVVRTESSDRWHSVPGFVYDGFILNNIMQSASIEEYSGRVLCVSYCRSGSRRGPGAWRGLKIGGDGVAGSLSWVGC